MIEIIKGLVWQDKKYAGEITHFKKVSLFAPGEVTAFTAEDLTAIIKGLKRK